MKINKIHYAMNHFSFEFFVSAVITITKWTMGCIIDYEIAKYVLEKLKR